MWYLKLRLNNVKIAKSNLQACTNEAARIFYNESTRFFEEFNFCIKTHIGIDESLMDNFQGDIQQDKKMFLPLSSDYPQKHCKWLTIGIGGSDSSERMFKETYPRCRLARNEPVSEGKFNEIGKVIPYGIGRCIRDFLRFMLKCLFEGWKTQKWSSCLRKAPDILKKP